MLDILILAGGLGTRLRSVISNLPKPMAPVGNLPFLEHILNFWSRRGVSRFILSVGYKAETIQDYFGEYYKNIKIEYIQEALPLGTGGAILNALRSIEVSQTLIIVNGDTWFDIDSKKIFEDFTKYQTPIIIGLKPTKICPRFDGASLDENGLIVKFGGNHKGSKYINAGIYIVNPKYLLKFMENFKGNFSFESTILKVLAEQRKVSASIQDKDFIDIGIPDDYARAERIILKN